MSAVVIVNKIFYFFRRYRRISQLPVLSEPTRRINPFSFKDLIVRMIVLLPFFVQSTISATLIKLFSLIQSSTACSVGVNFAPSFTVPFTVSFTVPFTVPFNEIFVLNTSPSINSGIVPEYTSVRFLHTIDCVRFMVPSSFKPRKISPPKRFRNAHNVSNTFFGKASLHSLNSIDIPSP